MHSSWKKNSRVVRHPIEAREQELRDRAEQIRARPLNKSRLAMDQQIGDGLLRSQYLETAPSHAAEKGGDRSKVDNDVMIEEFDDVHKTLRRMNERIDKLTSRLDSLPTLLREELERSSNGKSSWFTNVLYGSSSDEAQKNAEIKALRDQLEDVGISNSNLKDSLSAHHSQLTATRNENESLKVQVGQFQAQQAAWSQERSKLTNMIVNGIGDEDEPIDEHIVKAFTDLRTIIQRIVIKYCSVTETDTENLTPAQAVFYEGVWLRNPLSHARRARLRAEMFNILHRELFTKPQFGLEGPMEESLAALEKRLYEAAGENNLQITEWWKRTVQCAEMLIWAKHNATEKAITSLVELLHPVRSKDDAQTLACESDLVKLCDSTYRFLMMIRSSKSIYSVQEMASGRVVEAQQGECHVVDSFDGDRPDNERHFGGSTVYFTLFGALVKVDHVYGKQKVLERALVVCRKAGLAG